MSFARYPEYKDSGVEWLGEVPGHWEVVRLNVVATCNDEVLPDNTPENHEIEYVEISGVQAGRGIVDTAALPFGTAPSRARRVVRDGDVLISTVRTYLRAIAQVKNPPANMIASTGFAVLRPRRIDSGFLGYSCHAEGFVSEVIARSVGVSYPAINASELVRLPLPLPSPLEQSAIVTFLDRETAKIDALVAEQEKLIALLQEKRQAVISHAVTKGLDSKVPMKYSGVEWLGEVPAHWEVSQLRYVVREGTSITYGIVQAGPEVEDGVPYIRTSDMSGVALPLTGYPKTSLQIDASYARSKVNAGDLVISIRASVGKCLPVPRELDGANLTQGTAKIAPGWKAPAAYMLPFINSEPIQVYLDFKAKGATFKEITLETLRKTPFLLPPLEEQLEIGEWVRNQDHKFQSLIDGAEQAQELLRERRTALISAAVTGQIDVRNA